MMMVIGSLLMASLLGLICLAVLPMLGAQPSLPTSTCFGDLALSEFNALWDLYNSTNGLNWRYLSSSPASQHWRFPCQLSTPCADKWDGVVCTNASALSQSLGIPCTVTTVTLPLHHLVGTIPSTIALLENMYYLDLSGNDVYGTIPTTIGSFSAMQYLYLFLSDLTGKIPTEIGNLQELRVLKIHDDRVTGPIPLEIFTLPELYYLQLNDNLLTGTLPSEFGLLTKLQVLYLSSNRFNGTIPASLGQLPALQELAVNGNSLWGSIPSTFTNQNYSNLDFNQNQLTGSIPSGIINSPNLVYLYIYQNSITGTIPSTIGNCTSLQRLYAYTNLLSGTIPFDVMDGLVNVIDFEVSSNLLSGTLSGNFSNSAKLVSLSLDNNYFVGTVPREFGYFSDIELLEVSHNYLTGSIPTEFGQLRAVEILFLNNNFLTYTIPWTVQNLHKLSNLDFSANYLTGSFPTQLALLTQIEDIWLDNNYLTGTLPSTISNLNELQFFDVYANYISGVIPTQLASPNKLIVLYLNQNILWGSIPTELGRLSNLLYLYMDGNNLDGTIPSELGSLSLLTQLLLEDNSLTGSLPLELSHLSHATDLVVSYNFLTGSIPLEFRNLTNLNVLNVSSNLLSGDIERLFSPAGKVFSNLTYLDLSFNGITGRLPPELFELQSIKTIQLVSNCFVGSIPPTICDSNTLEVLLLDNLSSGSNCIISLPKVLSSFLKGVFPVSFLTGTIPNCVWSLPNLTTMHMSGNGLGGTLGDLSPSSKIKAINLANNYLTGDIPLSLQLYGRTTQWDMSTNRLSGTLSAKFQLANDSTQFDLSVNRLSGKIPSSVISARYVNILNGNLFECDSDVIQGAKSSTASGSNGGDTQGSTPENDPNSNKVVCGSDNFNEAMYIWTVILFFTIVVVVLIVYVATNRIHHQQQMAAQRSRSHLASMSSATLRDFSISTPQAKPFANATTTSTVSPTKHSKSSYVDSIVFIYTTCLDWWTTDIRILSANSSALSTSTSSPSSLKMVYCNIFLNLMTINCRICVFLSLIYIVVVMVSYILLKSTPAASYGTHTVQYAWITTSAYLHGSIPAILIPIFLLVSLSVIVFFLVGYLAAQRKHIPGSSSRNSRSSVRSSENSMQGDGSSSSFSFFSNIRASFFDETSRNTLSFAQGASSGRNSLGGGGGGGRDSMINRFSEIIVKVPAMTSSPLVVLLKSIILPLFFQLINLTMTLTVNATYVVAIYNGLTRYELFIVQLALSIYKLMWNSVYVFGVISELTIFLEQRWVLRHQISMMIVNFIVGPIIATVFSDSSCLYFAVLGQSSISSAYSDETTSYECSTGVIYSRENDRNLTSIVDNNSNLTIREANGIVICESSQSSVQLTSTLNPPWLYSYQCSSALLSNYIPVLIYVYTFSGIVIPILKIALLLCPKATLRRYIPRKLFKLFLLDTILCPVEPRDRVSSATSTSKSKLDEDEEAIASKSGSGTIFAYYRRQLFRGSDIISKLVLDISVLLTFGLASPILGITVAIDTLTRNLLWQLLIRRYLSICNVVAMKILLRATRRQQQQQQQQQSKPVATIEEEKGDIEARTQDVENYGADIVGEKLEEEDGQDGQDGQEEEFPKSNNMEVQPNEMKKKTHRGDIAVMKECSERLETATKSSTEGLLGGIIIAVAIVTGFWALLLFDIVADVYGNLAGGITSLVVVVVLFMGFCLIVSILRNYPALLNVGQFKVIGVADENEAMSNDNNLNSEMQNSTISPIATINDNARKKARQDIRNAVEGGMKGRQDDEKGEGEKDEDEEMAIRNRAVRFKSLEVERSILSSNSTF